MAGVQAEKGAPPAGAERRGILLAAAALVSLVALVFHGSLTVPFLFDDIDAIAGNPNIRQLWPLSVPLSWPATLPATTGRPLVSLTLALNYAVHGLDVVGYHLVSLALHAASTLLLLGILRRTLQTPRLHQGFGARALPLAAVVAAIWAVHPLQTEPVTYVIVRTELLVSFFYLLTLYASIRAWGSAHPGRWEAAAIAACALGMASKEIMVSAPLMVVAYDHVFLGDGPGLLRRRRLYLGLAATWAVLGGLLATGAVIRAAIQKDWGQFENLCMQSKVLAHYLRLVFWPHPLVITYDWPGPVSFLQALPFLLALGTAFIASAWAAWRRRPIGFLGLWFFLILAPTSSVLPLPTEVASERRMYLPLAAVLALVVVVASRKIQGRVAALGIVLPVLAVLGLVSASRIRDYETPLRIWQDATAKSPNSMLARNQYSRALFEAGRADEALEQSLESLRVVPEKNPIAHQNAGSLLVVKQKPAEALPHLEESVRLQPDRAKAHFVLGRALSSLGRSREAAQHYRRAFELEPGDVEACGALAMSIARATVIQDGVAQMEECVRRWPQDPRLRNNLASLLIQDNRHAEALAQLAESVRLDPSYALGRFSLSLALLQAGRVEDGVRELVRAYRDAGADEDLRRRILGRARALAGSEQGALRESVRSSQDPALDVLIGP